MLPAKPSIIADPAAAAVGASRAYTRAVSLFKAASTVSLLTLASRITGLVRDVLMASVFGVSALTDAFNVAFRIPNLFRRLFGEGAFSQAFVPVLAAHPHQPKARRAPGAWSTTWPRCCLDAGGHLRPRRGGRAAAGLGAGQRPAAGPARLRRRRAHDALDVPVHRLHVAGGAGGGILNTWKRFAVPAASPVLLNLR
jgi:putative peptidoglycan lipid II flippase